MTINIKDTITKKIMEDRVEPVAFNKVGEVGSKEVLNISGISSANAVGEVEEASDLESKGRSGGEHVSDPVMKTVAVSNESDEVSNEWIRLRRWCFGVRFVVQEESDDEDEGDDQE